MASLHSTEHTAPLHDAFRQLFCPLQTRTAFALTAALTLLRQLFAPLQRTSQLSPLQLTPPLQDPLPEQRITLLP
jgi:hypothetical protein